MAKKKSTKKKDEKKKAVNKSAAKKEAKAKKKSAKKSKEKSAKMASKKKSEPKKKDGKKSAKPSVIKVTGSKTDKSSNYNATEAVKRLLACKSLEELKSFTSGEKRVTVKRAIQPTINKLTKAK